MTTAQPRARGLGWLGLGTAIVTVATFGVAYTTPPRSGPFCASDCVTAPYTDVARFVPRDYLWMYPAVLVTILFLGVILACTTRARGSDSGPGRRVLGDWAVGIGVVAVAALAIDYGIQLSVIQPMLVRGEATGLGFLTQYHPVGVFIGLENIGYTAMALALLLAGFSVLPAGPVERVLRWVLVIGGLATFVALVAFGVAYGADLDYRYEVTAISITWLTLACAGVALAWQHLRPAPGPLRRPARTAR